MKKNLLPLTFTITLWSCEQKHPMAEKLCDCYTQLHRAQERRTAFLDDSCIVLYIKILKYLENKESEQLKFQKAYNRCQ